MYDMTLRYKVKPHAIHSNGRIIDFTKSLSNRDIEDIFKYPPIGEGLSLGEAYKARLDYCTRGFDASTGLGEMDFSPINKSLPEWIYEQGNHIIFNEEEIEFLPKDSI